MNNRTQIILIVGLAALLFFMAYNNRNNENNSDEEFSDELNNSENSLDNSSFILDDESAYFEKKDFTPPESDWLKKKFDNRNKAKGEYKRSSYCSGLRGNLGPSDWEDYFEHNNNVIENSQTGTNDNFLPIDESGGGYATFQTKGYKATCGSNQNCDPEDLFNNEHYLPGEVNDEWFEVQPEPVSVKNRHLINVAKPIGINTIGTSNRNQSYDIRRAPIAPKFVVSPWLQSSIEADVNLGPLN